MSLSPPLPAPPLLALGFAALVASGCGAPSPPAGTPLDQPAAWSAPLFHLPPDTLELPLDCLPDGAVDEDHWGIQGLERLRGPHWEAPLPFPSDKDTARFAPPGMRVIVDGEELPYASGATRSGLDGWSLDEGMLHLRVRGTPSVVQLYHPHLLERVSRLQPARADLEPEAFVRFEHSVEDVTRQGLLLPAPARAGWRLALPGGPVTFSAWPALIPPPQGGTSDGVTLTLLVDGEAVDSVRPSRRFDRWEVDLGAWAGQEVEVSVVSDPGRSSDHDYAFLGAPAVHEAGDRTRRILVVGLDTVRPDHLGAHGYHRPTPELDALAATAAVFERAWTPAPRTRPSFRTATTGRLPLEAVGATNLGEILSAEGFATAGFAANVHLHPRFGFHRGYDLWHLDPKAKADDQVDRALAWMQEHRDRDLFVFVHIMDPHLFYVAPEPWGSRWVEDPDPELEEKYSRWLVNRWTNQGISQRRQEHIAASYDGEVGWTSHQVGRLVDGLDALGGSNLVVVHSDHGEEFWEHGGFEHNHSLYDEVVRAVLWVRPPGGIDGGQRLGATAGIVDIVPTILDYVGADERPPSDGVSLRPYIEGTAVPDPERVVAMAHLRYDTDRWGVVYRDHKYILVTSTGEEELYDLGSDPAEARDLSDAADLAPFQAALARAHGVPVTPGWRVEIELVGSRPLEWRLPSPAVGAGIVDPEAISSRRANQAWGEPPKRTPEEVATATLHEGGTLLRIRPGEVARGLLWVRFDAPVPVGGELTRSGLALPLEVQPSGRLGWRSGSQGVSAWAGALLVPPPGEAARMGLRAAGQGGELDLLETLGYLGGEESDPP